MKRGKLPPLSNQQGVLEEGAVPQLRQHRWFRESGFRLGGAAFAGDFRFSADWAVTCGPNRWYLHVLRSDLSRGPE